MPHPPRDLGRDLQIVEAIVSELKEYLLSDMVYWSLSSRGSIRNPFPKGTLGGLLFRLHLLERLRGQLDPQQWERFAGASAAAGDLLRHWAVQAEQKAVREAAARLRTWAAFLEEAEGDPQRFNPEYANQAEGRTIIAFLQCLAGGALDNGALREPLGAADRILSRISTRDDFVWDERMESAFPEDLYPWLYVTLR